MARRLSATRLRQVHVDSACPLCGDEGTATSWHRHAFTYGSGDLAVELTVNVPVRRCGACDFEYLDEAAEHLKHEAVCKHLGVLSPGEIRRIRADHRMTRARFAQVTGLGEASLNRWENGLTVQTCANDRYLRLLSHPEIMQRLQDLMTSAPRSRPSSTPVEGRFRALEVTGALRRAKESFRLRKAL